MRILTCLIVEDEPLAARLLEEYVESVPFLRLVGKCSDALYAAEAIQQTPVDVLFLDLHLPGMKGLDFLRSLIQPPQVILTTAYHEYALESYDLNVVDYLLKPIDFERFIRSVQKIRTPPRPEPPGSGRAFHFFNSNKKMIRVWLDEIRYAESLKEYIRIHLPQDKSLLTKMQLGVFEQIAGGQDFLRIHRSYSVALRHIEAYSQTDIQVAGIELPIGRQYREEVLRMLGGLKTFGFG